MRILWAPALVICSICAGAALVGYGTLARGWT
jgi:hypothetical protein